MFALIQSPAGAAWRTSLAGACLAIQRMLKPKLDELPDPTVHGHACEAFWKQFVGPWKLLAAQLQVRVRGAHSAAALVISGIEALDGVHCPEEADSESGELLCNDCGRFFLTANGLAVHRAKAHGSSKAAGIKAVLRDGVCPVCDQDFRSRLRFVQHIAYGASRCRRAFEAVLLPSLSPAEQALAQAEELRHFRLCRQRGVHELSGLPVC